MIFDYFYTQNLFLTAVILAISSLLNDDTNHHDLEKFDALTLLLSQLGDSGNFVAGEFMEHISAIKPLLHAAHRDGVHDQSNLSLSTSTFANNRAAGLPGFQPGIANTNMDLATDVGLPEPHLYDLLTRPLTDIDLGDSSLSVDSALGFYWPNFQSGGV